MKRWLWLALILVVAACSRDTALDEGIELERQGRDVPEFSADSAYVFVEQQLAFGPRNPNSEGHRQAKEYYLETLRRFAGNRMVFAQRFEQQGYDETLQMANFIAAFNPEARDRILICAHWDTRPRAEEDPDPLLRDQPILGADDGGSGVAVLLELARIMSENMPPIGVDIVLFDGEDYGVSGDLENYFLGSRYWAANQPVPGYNPRFGILLDMVGGEGAVFPKEVYSQRFAPGLQRQVWSLAASMGYGDIFLDEQGGAVADDHLIINEQLGIPTINIIYHRRNEQGRVDFPPYWHTHGDNLDIISRETLQVVGDVMVELIYNRL